MKLQQQRSSALCGQSRCTSNLWQPSTSWALIVRTYRQNPRISLYTSSSVEVAGYGVWQEWCLKCISNLSCCCTEAVPKRILDIMNVDNLTRENVASHLQVRA